MRLLLVSGLALGILAGCGAPSGDNEPTLTERLAGKTVQDENGVIITFGADGVLSGTAQNGEAIVGTWEERDGKYCRAFLEPFQLSGCLEMVFEGNEIYGIREDGTQTSRATFQ